MQKDIAHIFGRYAGRELPMREETVSYTFQGKKGSYKQCCPENPDDPVLRELRADAGRLGLSLRLWFPGMIATMELNPNRLNVHVEKGADGKWRINDRISIDASMALQQTIQSIIARGIDNPVKVRPFRISGPPSPDI